MKKHLKEATAILIALLMVTTSFSAFSFSASAAESEDTVSTISVTTGNCMWVLDEHGTLTISGEGSMEDDLYLSWAYYKDIIEIVIIEAGLTSIGDKAFSECTSLTGITIPDSVTSIDDFAFYGCTSLENITIPNSVTGMGNYAFYGCTNLVDIVFPNNLTDIGFAAFKETKWFDKQPEGVVYAGNVACDYKDVGTTSPEPGGYITTVKPGTVSITKGAFFGSDINNISIPNTVKKIDSYAFANCKELNTVTIPPSVKSIGEKAFGYYSNNATIKDFPKFDDMEFGIYIFEENNNKGINIQGKKNSAAENYAANVNIATNNMVTFTEVTLYNYDFKWGTDNWSFDNNKDSFIVKNLIKILENNNQDEDFIKILAKEFLLNDDLEKLKSTIVQPYDSNWQGNCFGMTVAEILVKQELLDLKTFLGQESLYNCRINDDDGKIIAFISFLQALQCRDDYAQSSRSGAYSSGDSSPTADEGSQNSGTTSITQKNFIEKIEEELKPIENENGTKVNHNVILIEYEFKDSKNIAKCHAVLGYGIENLSSNYYSDVTKKYYDKRILIADPNHLSQKNEDEKNCLYDDACIYYNKNDLGCDWICPYWDDNNGKCYWNGNDSDPGHIISLIKYNTLTDLEFYPELPKDYIAGLTIFNDKGNQRVGEGITEYNIVDQLDDRKFYALDNNKKECCFFYDTPSDYSMMMDYEKVSYFAKVENGISTSVKPEGCINIKGSNATYSLTMMTDNPKESDWYSITVSGNNTNSVTLTKQKDGYFLETDTPGNVTITAKSDSGKTTGVYKISGGSAIIKKNGDNIIVEIQSNGGEDPNIELTPIMIGDVDYNGSIDVSDVTKIQKHLAHISDETELNNYLADTNGDEQVDINDATQIQKYLLKLVAALGKA